MTSTADFNRPLPTPDGLELDRELTAYHEAGHVYGYIGQRRELLAVSIVGTDAHRGMTSVVPARVFIHDMAIVAALGPVAQAIYAQQLESDLECMFDDFLTAAVLDGGDGDYEKSLGLLDNYAFVHALREDLVHNWNGIELLAQALLERDVVPGPEALALLGVAR